MRKVKIHEDKRANIYLLSIPKERKIYCKIKTSGRRIDNIFPKLKT